MTNVALKFQRDPSKLFFYIATKTLVSPKDKQETAKGGMTGLQSGNIIGKDQPRTNINAEVIIKYCMTLNRQSQG